MYSEPYLGYCVQYWKRHLVVRKIPMWHFIWILDCCKTSDLIEDEINENILFYSDDENLRNIGHWKKRMVISFDSEIEDTNTSNDGNFVKIYVDETVWNIRRFTLYSKIYKVKLLMLRKY